MRLRRAGLGLLIGAVLMAPTGAFAGQAPERRSPRAGAFTSPNEAARTLRPKKGCKFCRL